jgi:hypothetical protein
VSKKTEIIISPFFSSFFPSESQILCLPLIPALAAKYDKEGTGGNTTHREKQIISVLFLKFISVDQ